MIKHHPSTALLTDYTVGSLSVAPAVSVTTHLKFCQQCRDSVGSLKQLGGALLCEAEPSPISDDLLSQTLGRLDAEENEAPLAEGASEVHDFGLGEELKGIPDYLSQFQIGRAHV